MRTQMPAPIVVVCLVLCAAAQASGEVDRLARACHESEDALRASVLNTLNASHPPDSLRDSSLYTLYRLLNCTGDCVCVGRLVADRAQPVLSSCAASADQAWLCSIDRAMPTLLDAALAVCDVRSGDADRGAGGVARLQAIVNASAGPLEAHAPRCLESDTAGELVGRVNASRLFHVDASWGVRLAAVELGVCHAAGLHGFTASSEEAMRLFALAESLGSSEARLRAGLLLLRELPEDSDADDRGMARRLSGVRKLESAAHAGNADALLEVGMLHLTHSPLVSLASSDYGTFLLQRAARSGSRDAAFELGELAYGTGKHALAHDWYGMAAAAGDGRAWNALGMLHAQGLGVAAVNDSAALECFGKAALAGDAQGALNVGHMHRMGRGVPASAREALLWYETAAGRGSTDAMLAAGELLYAPRAMPADHDVPQDFEAAAKWFRDAAYVLRKLARAA